MAETPNATRSSCPSSETCSEGRLAPHGEQGRDLFMEEMTRGGRRVTSGLVGPTDGEDSIPCLPLVPRGSDP